jgi:glycosyltransferase involved in cell wall biosynthesis
VRILYFSYYFYPFKNAGAIRAKYFVDSLISDSQFEVKIMTNEPRSLKNKEYDLCPIKSINITNHMSNALRLRLEFIFGIKSLLKILLLPKCDLIIISSPPFFASLFAFMAAKLKGIKILMDIRDLYPEVIFKTNAISESSYSAKLLLYLEKYIYKNSNYLITVTEGLLNSIVNKAPYKKKIKLIRNGYGDIFQPYNDKYDEFTLVMHGNFGKFQNIQLLLELVNKIEKIDNDIKFLIIGDGPKVSLIKKVSYSNLTYIQSVDYSKVPAIVGKAHVGLSLRTNDSISTTAFPVKVYEYIGLELPVIITPISEAGTIVNSIGAGSQFNNEDITELINYILLLKRNSEYYKDIVNHIKIHKHKFSRAIQAEKLKDLLKS